MYHSDRRSKLPHRRLRNIYETDEIDVSSSTAWPLDSPMFMRRPIRRTAEMLGSDRRSSSRGNAIITRLHGNRRTREVPEKGTRETFRTERQPRTQSRNLPRALPEKPEFIRITQATKQATDMFRTQSLLWMGGIVVLHILLNLLVANLIAIANESAPALAVFRGTNPTFLYADDANQILGLGPYVPGWLLSRNYAEHGFKNYEAQFSNYTLMARSPDLVRQSWSCQIIPFGEAVHDAYIERLKNPSAMYALGHQNVNPVDSFDIKQKIAPGLPRFKEGCRCDLPTWITTLRKDALVPFWIRRYQASPSTEADLKEFCPPCRFKQADLATRDAIKHLPPPLPRYMANSAFLNAEPRWFYERLRKHMNSLPGAQNIHDFLKTDQHKLIDEGWAVPSDFFDYPLEAGIESRRKLETQLRREQQERFDEKKTGWRRAEEEARKRNEE